MNLVGSQNINKEIISSRNGRKLEEEKERERYPGPHKQTTTCSSISNSSSNISKPEEKNKLCYVFLKKILVSFNRIAIYLCLMFISNNCVVLLLDLRSTPVCFSYTLPNVYTGMRNAWICAGRASAWSADSHMKILREKQGLCQL